MATTYDPTKDAVLRTPSSTFAVTDPSGLGGDSKAITPSDTVDLASYPKAVVVTVTGNLVVLPMLAVDDGAHLIPFTGVPVGFVLPFRIRRLMATGTTGSLATVES